MAMDPLQLPSPPTSGKPGHHKKKGRRGSTGEKRGGGGGSPLASPRMSVFDRLYDDDKARHARSEFLRRKVNL